MGSAGGRGGIGEGKNNKDKKIVFDILTIRSSSCKILFADVRKRNAQLAQLVEQRTENPRVSGSIPELGIARV